ncbi:tocopherol cyclase family protein [Cryobacterium sp. SO2]|uniref:tocopherol cyclase family protein n=1 Tax=Cryobacterium sp. SO2 TaxID=1897060 RepID=UPI00223E46A3|nr:tocopherol cyclase family protein [Cryobacterium sp. SO2]WEO76878.1 tocopherol cyclase family protein [Cryobacterium sp. SO2]
MNRSDLERNHYMLTGRLGRRGYDWWWHSFTGHHAVTGEARAFFVEYFVINPAVSPAVVAFGQPPVGQIPSYVMLKAGSWGAGSLKKQLHAFHPVANATIATDRLELSVGTARLTETHITGEVSHSQEEVAQHPEYMSDSGRMRWDLEIDKKLALNVGYGASAFFRRLNAFTMFWHAEGMKTLYRGTVTIDGEEYRVTPETSFGYADKNWGTDFTNPWVWLASSNLTRRSTGELLADSAIDIGGGTPEVFGVPIGGKLIVGFHHEGVDYDFNFSRFWTRSKTAYRCTETETEIVWHVTAENPSHALTVDVRCAKEEMLLVNYEAPDGGKRHTKLWNGGTGTGRIRLYEKRGARTLVDDLDMRNIGCEYGAY